jgi:hypothetical protein
MGAPAVQRIRAPGVLAPPRLHGQLDLPDEELALPPLGAQPRPGRDLQRTGLPWHRSSLRHRHPLVRPSLPAYHPLAMHSVGAPPFSERGWIITRADGVSRQIVHIDPRNTTADEQWELEDALWLVRVLLVGYWAILLGALAALATR